MDTFEERINRQIEQWKPADKPRLVGKIISLEGDSKTFKSGDELYFVRITVEEKDGTNVEWDAVTVVPRRQLARLRPKVGERIAVLYLGSRSSGGGRDYEDFKIILDRPPEEQKVDWDRIAGDEKKAGNGVESPWDKGNADDVPF